MNLLDIIGPVMVGPSSSHTAGAVKIGRVCHKLLAEKVVRADIFFHGSFLATGKGHGTDKAVVAGLLGMQVDDPAIPHSFEIAEREGIAVHTVRDRSWGMCIQTLSNWNLQANQEERWR